MRFLLVISYLLLTPPSWQVHLLYETHANVNELVDPIHTQYYMKAIKFVAKGHLGWVLGVAQRPAGYYHRSYLVNGKPKDGGIFQLDQQCYPLLELCDFFEYFPEDAEFVRRMINTQAVQDVLSHLLMKQDTTTGLWPTEETPADDPVQQPYHFSSHVLLWRTITRLASLLDMLQVTLVPSSRHLLHIAAQLKQDTMRIFVADHPSGHSVFAYTTNGEEFHFYYDANDVPTLFAHDWGFISTPDEVNIWKKTMTFGLSAANTLGYSEDGPFRGLGSTHSEGAWTLGYFQELAYATWSNNRPLMQHAWKRITAAMQWDGTFSEAVSPVTAECTSKAWFSWPGAMIGTLLIKLRNDGLESILV